MNMEIDANYCIKTKKHASFYIDIFSCTQYKCVIHSINALLYDYDGKNGFYYINCSLLWNRNFHLKW